MVIPLEDIPGGNEASEIYIALKLDNDVYLHDVSQHYIYTHIQTHIHRNIDTSAAQFVYTTK